MAFHVHSLTLMGKEEAGIHPGWGTVLPLTCNWPEFGYRATAGTKAAGNSSLSFSWCIQLILHFGVKSAVCLKEVPVSPQVSQN